MKSDGKVKVVVKSRRVPAGTVDVSGSVFSPSGFLLGTRKDRMIRYDYVLDGEHQVAIEHAQKISDDLGLNLEIIDAGRHGVITRLFSSIGLRRGGRPTIVVSPSIGAVCSEISQPLVAVR